MKLDECRMRLESEGPLRDLLAPPIEEQVAAGYGYTLTEICQQPVTWIDTAARMTHVHRRLVDLLRGGEWLAISGSGSSQFVGECVDWALQVETGVPTRTVGGGWLLLQEPGCLSNGQPGVLVSLARSGDSPESAAVVERFLALDVLTRHLILSCNENGQLTTRFNSDPRVTTVTLDSRTNDRSLAMTSSFTNMAIATRMLGFLTSIDEYAKLVESLAALARQLLLLHAATLADVAPQPFRKVVYLASGCRQGAARESALKLLEMTSGRVFTMAESYLGLRHGPMCLIDEDTLLVCFLDAKPRTRAYEVDLIAELDQKKLGGRKLIFGEAVPSGLLRDGDVALELPGLAAVGDCNAPVIDVIVGQLLAFFRSRAEGLHPDMPSAGVINRVVNEFKIYPSDGDIPPDGSC